MTEKMPRTPFSTALSGSAKETEIRLKNIFSGPKKRPPALFLALMFSLCLFCGNLVSCQVAQAEEPDSSRSETEKPDSSASAAADPGGSSDTSRQSDSWQVAELENFITAEFQLDEPYPWLTDEEAALVRDLVEDLPVNELPRKAVDTSCARRQDYWRDMLLPVAYDEETDFTVYFVVSPGSMPDIEPGAGPLLGTLDQAGIVLRLRDHVGYFDWSWDINAKFGFNPLLAVDDFDGDSRPEAALSLTWGEGTGAWSESLYIIELDWGAMTYSVPDYSDIPLEITASPDGRSARMVSGDREYPVDLDQLGVPFEGRVAVGNQISFVKQDGQLICRLDLDFGCSTLGYLSAAHFPVIYEDGTYKLGPAVWMGDIL